jgi:Cu/Ag efflux protein CusF
VAKTPIIAWLVASALTLASSSPRAQQRAEHQFHGTVEKIDASAQTLTVNGDNVPNWMPPMTMLYKVSNPEVLRSLKTGDRITATVYDGEFSRLYRVRIEPRQPAKAAALPPISYVCPSPGEEGVIEDRPGRCPKSSQPLTPIRLTIAYSCLRGPRFIQEQPGTCSYDKSPLGPVTASVYWSCTDEPQRRYLAPGACKDGSARGKAFEIRPHGDHNPRHGGLSVFMSEDLHHHLEGTFIAPGIFRAYFYDEYTRPVPASGMTARVALADASAHEVGTPLPLRASTRPGVNFLEVRVPNVAAPTKTTPLDFKLHVTIPGQAREWVTDHHFDGYSKEPAPAPIGVPAKTVSSPPPPAAPEQNMAAASPPFTTQEEVLPDNAPQLLELLAMRASEVQGLLQAGNLGAVWFPAFSAKSIALALESAHSSALTSDERTRLSSAVRDLALTAWQMDAAGDLGDKELLLTLQGDFLQAVADIQAVFRR